MGNRTKQILKRVMSPSSLAFVRKFSSCPWDSAIFMVQSPGISAAATDLWIMFYDEAEHNNISLRYVVYLRR